eukprot:GEZU01042323.1.p1 GENE.GEZU01042323.1~~GEZU01042323.1.p1  ORF type:complete len:380 (-),score=102.64 GEZU01042323.1:256-1395(-)
MATQEELVQQESIYTKHNDLAINENTSNQSSLLLDFIKQLRPGVDFYKIAVPAHLIRPNSLLEILANYATPHDDILNVSTMQSAEQRFFSVCRWYLTGLLIVPQKGLTGAKPFNPVLGEQFFCYWKHPDSITTFIGEQVSHHPPVSAVFLENKAKNFTYSACYHPTTRFHGNSASTTLEGDCFLTLTNLDEIYTVDFPPVLARGLLWGSSGIEIQGPMNVACEKTGYKAVFDFKKSNNVEGYIEFKGKKLYELSGAFMDKLVIYPVGNTKKATPFFDAKSIPPIVKIVRPVAEQAENESRRVWHKAAYAIFNNQLDIANQEKSNVEEAQRQKTKLRKERGENWIPAYFVPAPSKKNPGTMTWVRNPGAPIQILPADLNL